MLDDSIVDAPVKIPDSARLSYRLMDSNDAPLLFELDQYPDNLGSIGVMKKLGMRYVDDRIHRTPKQDMAVAYYEVPAHDLLYGLDGRV